MKIPRCPTPELTHTRNFANTASTTRLLRKNWYDFRRIWEVSQPEVNLQSQFRNARVEGGSSIAGRSWLDVSIIARLFLVWIFAITATTVASCSTKAEVASSTSTSSALVQITTSTQYWKPLLIDVAFREDPVDVAAPWFEPLRGRESSVVDAAWYDAARQYLVIVLKGRAYHYCDLDRQTWTSFVDANSLGQFYSGVIRDNFDCRESEVPAYP